MNSSRAGIAMISTAFVIAMGAMAGRTGDAAGPSTIDLGTAANFSILAGTPSITNTGPTTVDLQVGIHPALAVTGFPPGLAPAGIHAGDTTASNAKAALVTAYDVAAGAPVTAAHAALGGLTLVGGVYTSGGATLDLTGVLTLDGQNDPSSVWIFKSPASDLVTASGSRVTFVNGASPCNVFWQIGSSATLGTGSTFVGTILALTSITLADSVTVFGRTLARNGTVTLINDHFASGDCASAPLVVPPTFPPFTIAPGATPTPVPSAITTFTPAPSVSPSATPIGTAASSGTPTTAPTAVAVPAIQTAAPAAIAGTQALPSTSTGDPSGPLTVLGLALTGLGILLLRGRSVPHL